MYSSGFAGSKGFPITGNALYDVGCENLAIMRVAAKKF
jgi:hypothetical protein